MKGGSERTEYQKVYGEDGWTKSDNLPIFRAAALNRVDVSIFWIFSPTITRQDDLIIF
jgi:hypothetical protein